MSDSNETKKDTPTKSQLSCGLLMLPGKMQKMKNFSSTHKRTGSTGTTGDESYTSDEEEDLDNDENYFRNPRKNYIANNFDCYSGISTIADKVSHVSLMPRNSSDISVYSGLEKCSDESVNLNESTSSGENEGDSDCRCDSTDWSKSVSVQNVDNFTFVELKRGLRDAHRQLRDRQEEIHKLKRIKKEVEGELEDLTASLFQEAHKLVREANEKQAAAERALRESEMKVEVLMAEVTALKTLVLTSTPSSPNPHLHPQIDKNKDEGVVIYSKKHNRSSSHNNSKYGRDSPPSPSETSSNSDNEYQLQSDVEIDPILNDEFLSWKEKPAMDKSNPFISRVYREDIDLCLTFPNSDLSAKVVEAVEKGLILIEAIGDKLKSRKCALMEIEKTCFYRMNLGDNSDNWFNISQICRNRITAVCDFLNYLKYIERGLVKSSAQDMYCEVIKLRKNMVLGRLGFPTTS